MKKKFLFRVFAIVIFCMASLAIKSETSACKSACAMACKKVAAIQPLILSSVNITTDPIHHDGFFTRI